MTDTPPPNDNRDDQFDESDQSESQDSESRRSGLSGLLRQLLETIQRMDETERSVERNRGRRRSGRTTVEYDYSVKIGGDQVDSNERTESDQPVRIQDTLDGASVTIDLPTVDPETLRAGVRGRRLVVASDDERVARVTLPETGYAVRNASYNNGVLEILLKDCDSEVRIND